MRPQDRVLRARLAAHAMHARHDSRETSRPGRDAAFARFLDQVDPDGVLSDTERARRALHAQKAHMSRLAYRSAQARRANKTGKR